MSSAARGGAARTAGKWRRRGRKSRKCGRFVRGNILPFSPDAPACTEITTSQLGSRNQLAKRLIACQRHANRDISWLGAQSSRDDETELRKENEMPSDHPELDAVVKTLKQGKTAEPTTIRDFLSWFGAQRRTSLNVAYIEKQLAKAGVRTVPGYLNRWVDSPVTFELISEHPDDREADAPETAADRAADPRENQVDAGVPIADDPSFRIGNIKSARSAPTSVKPNASLHEAMTLMLARNFSQLPVMTNERDVKGVISWASIGSRLAANKNGLEVRSYMNAHQEIDVSASLFAGIRIIAEHDYVLVRAAGNLISGIVTASDIALQFEEISKPFLLLAEIENHIRALIAKKLTMADIKSACGEEFLPANFSQVHELTFGNCVRILEWTDNWAKISLSMDRKTFCAELSVINKIRNDVMHFNPDPITSDNLRCLQDVSRMFDTLRKAGAF
jgi:CBS domain-containing protein